MDVNSTNHRLTRARGPITNLLASLAGSAPVDGSGARVREWSPSIARRWAT